MKVNNVSMVGYSSNMNSKASFGQNKAEKSTPKENKANYENPISRTKEKGLAVLSTVGSAAVAGAVVAGLATCLNQNKKVSGLIGLGVAAVTTALTLPQKLYDTKVNAFVKEKEMDVYSRDKSLKSNLTEEVHKEVLDPEVSLDKKLDHNFKLQMANRGNGVVIQS